MKAQQGSLFQPRVVEGHFSSIFYSFEGDWANDIWDLSCLWQHELILLIYFRKKIKHKVTLNKKSFIHGPKRVPFAIHKSFNNNNNNNNNNSSNNIINNIAWIVPFERCHQLQGGCRESRLERGKILLLTKLQRERERDDGPGVTAPLRMRMQVTLSCLE